MSMESRVDEALSLLREALVLLDREALLVPAAHVSLAIELIQPGAQGRDLEGLQ